MAVFVEIWTIGGAPVSRLTGESLAGTCSHGRHTRTVCRGAHSTCNRF